MANRFKTKITEMLGIEYPILCGGMQWVSRAEFVASVCNAGGIGFITAETFETPEDLREEIKKMRTLTDKPFGINISMLPEFGMPERTMQFCDIVCEEGITVVETAGKSPESLMPKFKEAGVKVIHKLTSVRHAESAQRAGVDAVTLIGYGSGGHVGMDNVASYIMIPLAVKRLDIPVVVGGGVGTGAGFLGALAMGAEAVLLGTAFFATEESPIHPALKQKLVDTSELDTTLVMGSIRNPMRCVKNQLANDVLALEAKGAGLEEIIGALAGGKGKLAYDSGDTEISPIACGQVVGLIDEIKSVERVITDIVSEASQLMERLNVISGKGI
ncbi:MAG: nitronate monooxygenase [Proteobacteria bacterium]|nr:nitronate monooxygenase [Pseudomonadota bacterium]